MDKNLLNKYGFVVDIDNNNYISYKLYIGEVFFMYINDNGVYYYEVYDDVSRYHAVAYKNFIYILDKNIALNRDNKINVILE